LLNKQECSFWRAAEVSGKEILRQFNRVNEMIGKVNSCENGMETWAVAGE
jgi:hypothetical protein